MATRARRKGRADHRARSGRARRARTEARILEAALRVFAEKGPEGPVIDDFVRAAGVSRGSFYNHFDGVEALLEATSVWTTESTVEAIVEAIAAIPDPDLRFGTGVRLFLTRAAQAPVWARFVGRVWKLGKLDAPRRDLAEAHRRGLLRVPDVEVAWRVVLGGLREALLALGTGRARPELVTQVVRLSLQTLGVPARRIAAVLARPPPELAGPTYQ